MGCSLAVSTLPPNRSRLDAETATSACVSIDYYEVASHHSLSHVLSRLWVLGECRVYGAHMDEDRDHI
jgi:hypothetical protein